MSIDAAPRREPLALLVELRKVAAFFRRDFLINWSYRLAFFSDWANMILQVALFYFLGRLIEPDRLPAVAGTRPTYVEFVVVGIAFASFLQIGLNRVVTVVRNEQLIGTLESLLMTPTSPVMLQLGSVAYDVVYVPIRMVIFFVLSALILDADFTFLGLFPVAAILLVFIPLVWGLGMVSAAGVVTFKRGFGVVGLGSLILTATSSTYFPIEVLPGWLQAIARYNPITIALRASREAMLGGAGWSEILPAVAALIPMAALALTAGIVAFQLALRRERRRGTLGLY